MPPYKAEVLTSALQEVANNRQLPHDGDGWLDIYFINGARLEDPMPARRRPDKQDPRFWNRLYRNLQDE